MELDLSFVETFRDFVDKVKGVKGMLLPEEHDAQTRFVVVGGTSIAVEDIVAQLNGGEPVGFLDVQEVQNILWHDSSEAHRVFHIETDFEKNGARYRGELLSARSRKKEAIERLFVGHEMGGQLPDKAAVLLALPNGLPAYTTTGAFLAELASLDAGALVHETARQVEGALMPQSSAIDPARLRPVPEVVPELTSELSAHLDLPGSLLKDTPFVLLERALMGHPLTEQDAEQMFRHDQTSVGARVPLNPLGIATFAAFYAAPAVGISSFAYLGSSHPAALPILAVTAASSLLSFGTYLATISGFDPTRNKRRAHAESTRRNTLTAGYLAAFNELEAHFEGLSATPLGALWTQYFRLVFLQRFSRVEGVDLAASKEIIVKLSSDPAFEDYAGFKGKLFFQESAPTEVLRDFSGWKEGQREFASPEAAMPRPLPKALKV